LAVQIFNLRSFDSVVIYRKQPNAHPEVISKHSLELSLPPEYSISGGILGYDHVLSVKKKIMEKRFEET